MSNWKIKEVCYLGKKQHINSNVLYLKARIANPTTDYRAHQTSTSTDIYRFGAPENPADRLRRDAQPDQR